MFYDSNNMTHIIWVICSVCTKHLFRYRFQYQMKRLSKQVWTVSANVHFTAKICFSGTFNIFYLWSRAFRTRFLTSCRICFDSSERKWWNNEPLRLIICQKCGTVCLFNHTVCYYDNSPSSTVCYDLIGAYVCTKKLI